MPKVMKNKNTSKPPRTGKWLLKRFLKEENRNHRVGDFEEIFNFIWEKKGKYKAYRWYWIQVIGSIPHFVKHSISWSGTMFINYLKIALRSIEKEKGYSFINIMGLAIGLTCCILILLWVQDEMSYDRFHENADNLFWIEENLYSSGKVYHTNATPYPAAQAFQEGIPEIVNSARYAETGELLLRYQEKSFFENKLRAVDPSFFQIFTFPFIEGDMNTALSQPFSMVITENMAQKYFSDEEPVGKVISINNQYDFTVTGVIKNVPGNSSLQFDMIVPIEFMKKLGWDFDNWSSISIYTFVQLNENRQIEQVEKKMTDLFRLRRDENVTEIVLAPIKRVHLYSYVGNGNSMGDIQYVYIFSVIALFVLCIACINFMNLSTARSAKRAREIGIRKVSGALRGSIIKQFFAESLFLSFLALIIAIIIVLLLIPAFNTLSGKEFSYDFLKNRIVLTGLIGITLFTGIVAGTYPALFLSSFQPVKVLKGRQKSDPGSYLLRKILVIIQFSLSIFLIIGTTVIYNQLRHMKNIKLGYTKEHVIYIPMKGSLVKSYKAFKTQLTSYPGVTGVTAAYQLPTNNTTTTGWYNWDGMNPDEYVEIGLNIVDFDFPETLEIEVKEGRSFSQEFPSDTSGAFIVNEEMAKLIAAEPIVGMNLSFSGIDGRIIGVTKNFHYKSLRNKIGPLVFFLSSGSNLETIPINLKYVLLRIQQTNIRSSIEFIESTLRRVVPDYPFEYSFLDENFDALYRAEERMSGLFKYFTILAIFIASLGLFGLASYTAERRTREIGIRKVLGASESSVMLLVSKEFIKWVTLANILAWPAAYFAMNKWLDGFAYRINMGIFTFLLSAVLAFVVAIITVSSQSYKAARIDPVTAIKCE